MTDAYTPRQEQILDALEEIFVAEGFQTLTAGELANRVRCSLRTMYQLAPTKEQLFLMVLNRMWDRVGEEARRALAETEDPGHRIELFIRQSTRIMRPPWDAFFRDIQAYEPARRLFAEHLAVGTAFLAQVVAEGVESGHFRPVSPRLVAKALETLAMQATTPEFVAEIGMDAAEAEQELARLILHGLLKPTGRSTSGSRRG